MPHTYLRSLRIASVAFLALPWTIFLASWVRPAWAFVFLLVLSGALWQYVVYQRSNPSPLSTGIVATNDGITTRTIVFIVVIAVVWVSLSGAGGIGFQNQPDWNNKSVLMSDLMRREWPVSYDDHLILNYYFALYLPASVVGRLAGWNAAELFLYLEVLVGAVLSLTWLYSFAGEFGMLAVALFIGFGGLDLVGYMLVNRRAPQMGVGIEWWSSEFQFSGTTTLLFWVPQHSLPAWIATSLMLDEGARFRRVAYAGLFAALSLLWSPFVALGLLPIGIAMLFVADRETIPSFANFVFLPAMAALAYVFYAPHKSGGHFDSASSFWIAQFSAMSLARMAVFYALEIGIYALFVAVSWKSLERHWHTFAIIIGIALPICLLIPERVGHGGFMMRSSIPSLFLLFLLMLHVLATAPRRAVRFALASCLLLGMGSAFQEISRSILRYPTHLPATRPASDAMHLREKQRFEFVMPYESTSYQFVFRTPHRLIGSTR